MEHPEIVSEPGEHWSDHHARLERHHTFGVRDGLHFNVVTRVLNAASFGVPKTRERVVFVGFPSDLGVDWSFPERPAYSTPRNGINPQTASTRSGTESQSGTSFLHRVSSPALARAAVAVVELTDLEALLSEQENANVQSSPPS
jgi:site-specific DNA-cytosine methylase